MTTFWTTCELRGLGKSAHEIRQAAAAGRIEPVRRGHWVVPGAAAEVVRAARVGGVATATTASRALGLWTPPDPEPGGDSFRRRRDRLQVAVASSCSRLRDPDDATRSLGVRRDVVVHYVAPDLLAGTGRTRIAGPLLLLSHVFTTQPPERALAVLDSALHLRRIGERDLPALAALLPAHLRPVLLAADGRADSGIETIVRHLLRMRGLRIEVLPRLDGIGEVDLLVEGRLIIECDGREFHDDDEAFERDRGRDLRAAQGRYRVLRLTWPQVLFAWAEVEEAVFAALAS
ncbi:endonuclease domain-containing protein [Amnibacterium endophyticum]|uniref:Endonuclease domain-containing protein n=1 Tax=Amnibacterium endophyticum TaxID=2109337 RepID=A0ABW4LFJ5_9MICO